MRQAILVVAAKYSFLIEFDVTTTIAAGQVVVNIVCQ